MTDRPILFSASMVRALLEGRKTQTRRVIKARAPFSLFDGGWADEYVLDPGNAEWRERDVKFRIGDRLWVRETCAALEAHDGIDCIRYDADQVWRPIENSPEASDRWGALHHYGKRRGASVPSIHMPRWASRLTLVVTDVRVRRLQDITREDAMEEGVVQTWGDFAGDPPEWAVASINRHGDASGSHIYDNRTSVENFRELWNHINAERGFGWDENPWVVALTFDVHCCNIDQMEVSE